MKYKGLFRTVIILVAFSFIACSKVLYTNIDATPVNNPSKNCLLLSISEELPEGCKKIADFDYRESWNTEYDYLFTKMRKIASDKNADILKISEIHTGNMNTKGAAIRYLGTIYASGKPDIAQYLDSLNKAEYKGTDNKILLYIYRSDWGGPSLFDIDLYVDSEYQGKLKKKDIKIIELDKDGEIRISGSQKNNTGLKIKVEYGKKYYIQVYQIVNSVASPNSVQVGVGGQVFLQKQGKQGLFDYDALKFRFESGYR